VDEQKVQELKQEVIARLEESMELSKTYQPHSAEWLSDNWSGFKGPEQLAMICNTGISTEKFDTVAAALTTTPGDFALHPIINRAIHAKKKMVSTGEVLPSFSSSPLPFPSPPPLFPPLSL
jgi:2-oxoglutarate dehydrogenase complex dehydrogenase (E1) component-like enzyme